MGFPGKIEFLSVALRLCVSLAQLRVVFLRGYLQDGKGFDTPVGVHPETRMPQHRGHQTSRKQKKHEGRWFGHRSNLEVRQVGFGAEDNNVLGGGVRKECADGELSQLASAKKGLTAIDGDPISRQGRCGMNSKVRSGIIRPELEEILPPDGELIQSERK